MSYYYELPKLHNLTIPAVADKSTALFEIVATPTAEMLISHTLNMHLCEIKAQIEDCGEEPWDSVKKYTNPFEFIHTAIPNCKTYTTVSKLRPLSRSFYKMIELYATFFNL